MYNYTICYDTSSHTICYDTSSHNIISNVNTMKIRASTCSSGRWRLCASNIERLGKSLDNKCCVQTHFVVEHCYSQIPYKVAVIENKCYIIFICTIQLAIFENWHGINLLQQIGQWGKLQCQNWCWSLPFQKAWIEANNTYWVVKR